ncbi:MAG: bifunctional DNA-formamidopyrimidine glycosylase/DNA-(apurinic or apyrimidinic site) lyase [Anaerolineae bacterium]
MPELPEVEILKEELRREVVGRRVRELAVFEKTAGQFPVAQLREAAEGRAIAGVRRRGKMLVLDFEGGHSLVIHLMMAGQLLLSPPFTGQPCGIRHIPTQTLQRRPIPQGQPRDVCLELKFADDVLTLGQVRLKYVHLLPTAEVDDWPPVAKLGVDPFDETFTVDLLRRLLAKRRGMIKSTLMNQAAIAGLGNVYTDEILFRARLHPRRRASELSEEEVKRLHASIVAELQRGLELGGSSEMAFVHLDGSVGSYQETFQVKGRKGKSCFVCATPIERIKVGGRGTYFCPRCQAVVEE